MDRIPQKSNPHLFDREVLKIQKVLADAFSWLDHSIGICETLIEVKDGKRFVSANLYKGNGHYEQIMPCDELGNFSFFTLRDPQEVVKNNMIVKSPFSLIVWYDTRKVSFPCDERDTEQIKGQILGVLHGMHAYPALEITRVYENPKNVFADYSYDSVCNQFLMSPYAGLRIDGVIYASIPCYVPDVHEFGSLNSSYNPSFDL